MFAKIKFFLIPTFILIIATINIGYSLPVLAADQTTNPISFSISKVIKDGKDNNTKSAGSNEWKYDNELTLDDSIKYAWSKTDLNLKYKDKPAKGGGYLKIYKDSDATPDNFLIDYGSSPLQVNKFGSKLKDGDTKLVFQYIDYTEKVVGRYIFSFKFRNFTSDPQISILQPTAGSVFAKGVDQDFTIDIKNFSLETNNSNNKTRGKLNIYFNEVKNSNLIGTLNYSKDLGNGISESKFNSKDFSLEKLKIPDSVNTNLIFVLTKTTGELLPYQSQVSVQTNYNGSINIGLPKITILEPRKDRTDLQFDGDKKIVLQIDNFEILSERQGGGNDPRKGYLQIFVDEVPIKTVFAKSEFTLNSIGFTEAQEGRKTIKVQLINKDYTKLNPEASDSVDILYIPRTGDNQNDQTPQVENNSWRIVIVVLTVVLVIGGIAVLITKG